MISFVALIQFGRPMYSMQIDFGTTKMSFCAIKYSSNIKTELSCFL